MCVIKALGCRVEPVLPTAVPCRRVPGFEAWARVNPPVWPRISGLTNSVRHLAFRSLESNICLLTYRHPVRATNGAAPRNVKPIEHFHVRYATLRTYSAILGVRFL